MTIQKLLISLCLLFSIKGNAQKIENIYVNLYTDSLKKGTFNYINIDGKLSNGMYTPLDSTNLIFWSSDGKFHGNSLWLDKDFKKEMVFIKVVMKNNPSLSKEFTLYIKQKPDDERLKTSAEIMNEINTGSKKGRAKK